MKLSGYSARIFSAFAATNLCFCILVILVSSAAASEDAADSQCLPASRPGVFVICSRQDFLRVMAFPSDDFELGQDIDISTLSPIVEFEGTFDGRHFKLKGFSYKGSASAPVGLFRTNYGTIKRVALTDVSIRVLRDSNVPVGAIAGINLGTISQTSVSGVISGYNQVGGIVGFNNLGVITRTSSTANVSAKYFVGGIVGRSKGLHQHSPQLQLEKVYFGGSVEGNVCAGGTVGLLENAIIRKAGLTEKGYVLGWRAAGGVVGCAGYGVRLEQVYSGAMTAVIARWSSGFGALSSYAGGLLGEGIDLGGISESYSAATVSAGDYAGGLVGSLYNSTIYVAPLKILDSFAKGKVSAIAGQHSIASGIVGDNVGLFSQPLFIERCYSSAQIYSTGSGIGGAYGLSQFNSGDYSFWNKNLAPTAPLDFRARTGLELTLRTTFTQWDFENVWFLPEGSSPLLRWMLQ